MSLSSSSYEHIIKSLLRAWFKQHGVDAKIPDYTEIWRGEYVGQQHEQNELARIYHEARIDWLGGPFECPAHVHESIFGKERLSGKEPN